METINSISHLYRERLKNREMARRRPEFESGLAGAEAAKLKKFSDAGGSQIQWLSDAARTDYSITSGITSDLLFGERAAVTALAAPATTSTALPRASLRHMEYRLAAAPVIAPRGVYVGELQERWQFPSDHLPIGMSLDGLKIVSWNVLNPAYMHWVIEKNSQGLSRSQIADDHRRLPGHAITVREENIIDSLIEMIQSGQSVLALQECGRPFLEALEKRLPEHFAIVREQGKWAKDQNVVIYDKEKLTLLEQTSPKGVFSLESRPFMDLLFERTDTHESIRILNTHLPGDPAGPARYEFGAYVEDKKTPGVSTIALGDMNFNEIEMRDAFQDRDFVVHTPYCTNVGQIPFFSKAIDHFIVHSAGVVSLQKPDEVYPGLSKTVSLLENK